MTSSGRMSNGSDERIIPGSSIDRSKRNGNFDKEKLGIISNMLSKTINHLSQTSYAYREITSEFKNKFDLNTNPFAQPRRSQSTVTNKHNLPNSKKTKLPYVSTVYSYSLRNRSLLITKKQYPPPFPTEYFDGPLSSDQWLALNVIVKSEGIRVLICWNQKQRNLLDPEPIKSYELYMCKETDKEPEPSMWNLEKKFTALKLPMLCKFNVYHNGFSYYIAIRAIDRYYRRGPFSIEKVTIL